jgi:hypothetical protein
VLGGSGDVGLTGTVNDDEIPGRDEDFAVVSSAGASGIAR